MDTNIDIKQHIQSFEKREIFIFLLPSEELCILLCLQNVFTVPDREYVKANTCLCEYMTVLNWIP